MKQISAGTHTDAILGYETREEATKVTTTVPAAKMSKSIKTTPLQVQHIFLVHFLAFSKRLPCENP